MGLPGPGAAHAVTIFSWPSRARGGASAHRATAGAWRRPLRTWSITLFHPLRPLVTALALGNAGKSAGKTTCSRGQAGQLAIDADTQSQKRSHDTSRIAWAKLLSRIAEEFPLVCPTLWWRHPPHLVQAATRVRNLSWPSHSWQPSGCSGHPGRDPRPIRKILASGFAGTRGHSARRSLWKCR